VLPRKNQLSYSIRGEERVSHRRPVPVRRRRPNRPTVDNASCQSWCPQFGDQFNINAATIMIGEKDASLITGRLTEETSR